MAFKLSNLLSKGGAPASPDTTLLDDDPGDEAPAKSGFTSLPGIGHQPVAQQLRLLAGVFVALLVLIAALVWNENRSGTNGAAYLAASGQMRMLSQRLAKAAQLGLQGDAASLKETRESREAFASYLDRLTRGGEIEGIGVPGSPDRIQPELTALATEWEKVDRNALALLGEEKALVALGNVADKINAGAHMMHESAEQIGVLMIRAGALGRELLAANQLLALIHRVSNTANEVRASSNPDPARIAQLGKDAAAFRDTVQLLLRGSDTVRAASDPEARQKLGDLAKGFQPIEEAIAGLAPNAQKLVQAKQAGAQVVAGAGGGLLAASDRVAQAYSREFSRRTIPAVLITILGALAVGVVFLIIRIYNEDSSRRTIASERERKQAEADKNATQQAILRLMNEMGDLADGDLTIRATVTEDITGAIADSVNYTIEELSVLVKRINETAARVTGAAESAQRISSDLLAAQERQSREIQDASQAVLSMAQQMNNVSSSATQSAQVARKSLEAAQKGATAVEDSIKGMNEIREQIQETSKRIKRLGESSQEIGEIVELISDITEQTNVLALNAAIQAASAGEAGRGFTVVAEEVQRLAERSAEATKQIAAIVKTIQTDTQDAVTAMEKSTQGVVEGAKLSDAAGRALAEISAVSNNLATLIEEISGQTQTEAGSATRVAESMKSILDITRQTSAGTKQTAVSIGQLAELAGELKGSVSGFKV